jgi:hypothetical protein
MRILPDLNAVAIQLIEDHPGHEYIANEIVPALRGEETFLMFGYLPLRVQWLLEDFDFSTVEARNAVSSLLQYPMESPEVTPNTILHAYEISSEKNHDVYDCFYIALAREAEADTLLTTDRDFEELCDDEPFEYLNPVPEEVLSEFHSVS